MKIKVVEFILRLEMGGAQEIIKNYSLYLNSDKFDLTVLVYTPSIGSAIENTLQNAGIKVVYIGNEILLKTYTGCPDIVKRFERQIKSTSKLYQILKKLSPDILHIHSELFRAFLLIPFHRWNIKLVFTCHNETGIVFKSRLNLLFARFIHMRYGIQFIALHKKGQHDVNKLFNTNNTVIINNGIDLQRFKADPEKKASYLQALNIPMDSFIVGNVGRFSYAKNHVFIIRIFSGLLKEKKNARLLLIGDGELKEEIIMQIHQFQLDDYVTLLNNRNDIPELLNIMDIFFFPSHFEGLPVALLEAQAAGLKCVISDRIDHASYVTDRITELNLSNPESDWIQAIISNNSNITPTGHLEDYDIRACVNKLEDLYIKVHNKIK